MNLGDSRVAYKSDSHNARAITRRAGEKRSKQCQGHLNTKCGKICVGLQKKKDDTKLSSVRTSERNERLRTAHAGKQNHKWKRQSLSQGRDGRLPISPE